MTKHSLIFGQILAMLTLEDMLNAFTSHRAQIANTKTAVRIQNQMPWIVGVIALHVAIVSGRDVS